MPESPDKFLKKSVTADNIQVVTDHGVFNMMIPFYPLAKNELTALLPNPPLYWSHERDFYLRYLIHYEAMWAAAVGIAVSKIAANDFIIKTESPIRAKRYRELFLYADGRRVGWVGFISKHLRDYLTTDNGAFVEIVRSTKAPASKIMGLKHLDSYRCTRTGDPERPVIYKDLEGKEHVLRDYQVMSLVDMPDPSEIYFGTGECAASRSYPSIHKLASIERYLSEKVTGRKPLAIYIVNGLTTQHLENTVKVAEEKVASRGALAYMGAVIMGVPTGESASVATINLAELPNNFNRKEEFDIAVLNYANNLGLDPQDLQPLSHQPMGGGSQQSIILQEKARAKGLASWKKAWIHACNEFVLPPDTEFSFEEKDYRDELNRFEVESKRASVATSHIMGGITSAEEERRLMVEQGFLPEEFMPTGQEGEETAEDEEKVDEDSGKTSKMPEPPQGQQPGGGKLGEKPGANGKKPAPGGKKPATDSTKPAKTKQVSAESLARAQELLRKNLPIVAEVTETILKNSEVTDESDISY